MAIARLIGCVGLDHTPHEPQKIKRKNSRVADPTKNEGAHGEEEHHSKQNASRKSSWEPVAKFVKDLSSSSMRFTASLNRPNSVPSNEGFTEAEIAEADYYNEMPNSNMAQERECMVPRPPRAEKSEGRSPARPPSSMGESREAVARESRKIGQQSRPQRKLPPGSMEELRTAVALESRKAGLQPRPLRVALRAFNVANRTLATAIEEYETLERKRDGARTEPERTQIRGEMRELRGKLEELQSIKDDAIERLAELGEKLQSGNTTNEVELGKCRGLLKDIEEEIEKTMDDVIDLSREKRTPNGNAQPDARLTEAKTREKALLVLRDQVNERIAQLSEA